MSVPRYVVRRILQAVPLLLGVVVFNFVLIQVAPGNPIHIMAGEHEISAEYEAELREKWGLDRPLLEQLWRYVLNVARGDLGQSFFYQVPVLQLLMQRLPRTLVLMFPAWVLGQLGGLALGVIAARWHRSPLDNSLTFVSLLTYSLPTFWMAIMLLAVGALRLGWFPAQGMVDVRADPSGMARVADIGQHMVLPMIALAGNRMARAYRLTRSNLLEVMTEDYIRTARAKGVSDRTVFYTHALRNAALPVITVAGISLGYLVSGSVTVETVFAWPGMGRLVYKAIFMRDYPVMLGALMMVSVTMIIANLITDVVYALVDPRIRYS